MVRTGKKLIFGPDAKPGKRKKRSPQEIVLEKAIRKIQVKNPATGRVNSLWNFRILSPKELKKMTSPHRKAFVKLHKEYLKQEKRVLNKWRKTHGLKKQQVEHVKELPSHLLKRHNLLVKQHAGAMIDMGEGPMKAKDLLKRWAKDPKEYANVIKALDKHHKKERGRLIKEHGDMSVTMPDGTTKTVKHALQEATKTGNRDLFAKAIKATKAIDKFAKKEAKMSPKQVANAADRFRKIIDATIKKVDSVLTKKKEEATTDEEKVEVETVAKDWDTQRSDFQKKLEEAKAAVEILRKKKKEFLEKAEGAGVEKARTEHEKKLKSMGKEFKRKMKDIEDSDDSDEDKDEARKKLITDMKTRKEKAYEALKKIEKESEGKEKKKKKKGKKGSILAGLFKALAGTKRFLGRAVSGVKTSNYDEFADIEQEVDGIMRGFVRHLDRDY